MLRLSSRAAVLAAAATFAFGATANELSAWQRPAVPPAPADNAVTPLRVELGRALFFDPRLSAKGVMSCASCHNPALGWSDGRATAVGYDMKILGRATPTIVNAAFNPLQMGDGRNVSLGARGRAPRDRRVEQHL